MPADFDAQIKTLEDEIEAIREPLREETENWLAATAPHAAEYWEAQARNLITQQPEKAKGIGSQGMTNLKGDVNSLIAKARSMPTATSWRGTTSGCGLISRRT